jgi:hypothetical protein
MSVEDSNNVSVFNPREACNPLKILGVIPKTSFYKKLQKL